MDESMKAQINAFEQSAKNANNPSLQEKSVLELPSSHWSDDSQHSFKPSFLGTAMSAKQATEKNRLPSNPQPDEPGHSFFVPVVINGVPFAFLHDTGANQTYMDEETVRRHGLGHLIRNKPPSKCVPVVTAGPKDSVTCLYMEADMVFNGAMRHTYIHIMSGLGPNRNMLLLGTDITDPKNQHGWVRKEAKVKKSNGLFNQLILKASQLMLLILSTVLNWH
jgi:hypothetical protein